MKDYYEILGVSKDASQEEIKKKYRTLALKMHPDRLVGKPESERKEIEKRFQEITNAYEVLSNENSRKKYDLESRGGSFDGFGGFGGDASSFEDIFESFFWGGGRETSSSKKRDSNSPKKGEDILLNVSISFKESVLGVDKKFKIDLLISCSKCSQTGAYSNEYIKNCSPCNGKGVVDVVQRSLFGNIRTQSICSHCQGLGKIISKKCDLCKGSKFTNQQKIIDVKIPKGIKSGQRLRMSSSGNDGLYGAPKGDIFVDIKVKDHKYFQRKGNDIHIQLPISFIDSILGGTVKVITVEGVEDIKIPQGSQFGESVVLKNRGFYSDINSKSRGDFYIWLQIKLPKKIGSETEEIFRKMQEKTSWDPNKNFLEKNKDIINEQ
ncbi:MAG: Chaperone protein DnaJ [Mycoplasmataceae bacterium]|nr:MAG: Chaperone protein DnaJ [Mycoplasmataceae bacterium]